ncbi:nucleotide-binding protein [Planctomycetales bacterium]|nr:nucleotide-binding protein [Planctomycetales bacterium]
MNIVLDCTAAIEIALENEKTDAFQKKIDSCGEVFVPDFFLIETANVLWKYCRAGILTDEDVKQKISFIEKIPSVYIPNKTLVREAVQEAIRLNHSVYDMLYFVLAHRYNAVLMTLDKHLRKLAEQEGIEIFPV